MKELLRPGHIIDFILFAVTSDAVHSDVEPFVQVGMKGVLPSDASEMTGNGIKSKHENLQPRHRWSRVGPILSSQSPTWRVCVMIFHWSFYTWFNKKKTSRILHGSRVGSFLEEFPLTYLSGATQDWACFTPKPGKFPKNSGDWPRLCICKMELGLAAFILKLSSLAPVKRHPSASTIIASEQHLCQKTSSGCASREP